ncbi:hypothetical protein G9A89_009712 [Geosiphon pyriformis]|nr:hypothetical protein G9A89_009712 [Geosiphon pyriformis]
MKSNGNDKVLDGLLSLSPSFSLKSVVQISIRKSFALDIEFMIVAGKFSQEKLFYVRKIFSDVNSFGRAFTPSKFGEIIWVFFTSEMAMMAAAKLANDCEPNQADLLASKWSILIEKNTVYVAKTNVDKQTWNIRNKFRALFYTLPINFIGFVNGKTCFIDCNLVNYTYAYCVIVCFDSELDLTNALAATSVIKGVDLRWSYFLLALCSVCKNNLAPKSRKTLLSAQNQFRLAKIYEKKSASASMISIFLTFVFYGDSSHLGSIDDSKPPSLVIDKLAKRLESLVPTVSQPSPGCQLSNPVSNIVMGVSLNKTTGGETATVMDLLTSSYVVKLENILEGLSASVLSLFVHFDGLVLAGSALP